MKKLLLIAFALAIMFSATTALAAEKQSKIASGLTYFKEWIVLNVLTWKAESKVLVLDDLASNRVTNIQTANESGDDESISKLTERYLQIKDRETNKIETKKHLRKHGQHSGKSRS